jgi:hypothetical protein
MAGGLESVNPMELSVPASWRFRCAATASLFKGEMPSFCMRK